MAKITVITADVIDSKRAGINPESINRCLKGLSHSTLVVPFTSSRGDEIQGVMEGWLTAPELVRALRWHCHPLQLRVGIGTGHHEGGLGQDPWQLSGPAFFRARQALDTITANKEAATRMVTGSQCIDTMANSVWLLLDTIMGEWTAGQWEAVMTYEKAGTYRAAAEILGVAAQNIQKRCKAAHWNHVRQAEAGLGRVSDLVESITL